MRTELEARGRLATRIEARPEDDRWQVGYFDGDEEVAVVFVDPRSGAVREAWTGDQVAWPMARGYESQFGHALNAPYVWIPLCALFVFGLLDWRRPWRIAHLDLLVLVAFGVSHVFFNQGEIAASVPLVYPCLVYLLARMLWLGWRGGEPLRPRAPVIWLAVAAVVLIAFRLTLNVADSGVIDVGYAGTVGADRITSGEQIYGEGAFPDDNPFGDTYGPANYYAYVPFELALPWSGEWDGLAASHAAAIAFDLLTVAGLFVFGARMRPGSAGTRARDRARVRLDGLPLHGVRPAIELQRLPGRRAGGLEPGAVRAAASPAAPCWRSPPPPSSRPWCWRHCSRPGSEGCSHPPRARPTGHGPRGWARWRCSPPASRRSPR